MDGATQLQHLLEAEAHFAQGERHIAEQEARVEELDRDGCDNALARELLVSFAKRKLSTSRTATPPQFGAFCLT